MARGFPVWVLELVLPVVVDSSYYAGRLTRYMLPVYWFSRLTRSRFLSRFVVFRLFQGNPQYLGEFFLRLDD